MNSEEWGGKKEKRGKRMNIRDKSIHLKQRHSKKASVTNVERADSQTDKIDN